MNKKYISRLVIVVIFCMLLLLSLTGCNYQMVDLTYSYNYAYISLPNGECVEGKVTSWKDFEDGDQIQVVINGVTYLTDTTRCVLIKK